MGKKRSKTKARQTDQLRALFESAPASTQAVALTKTQTLTPTQTVQTATVPTEVTDARATAQTRTHVYEQPEQTQTRAPLRTVISDSPYKPARRIDIPVKLEEDDRETPWWLGLALIAGAVAMLGIGWFHIERSNMVAQPVGHPTSTMQSLKRETTDKINFYRTQLGHRLNRDRVNVEILNARVAPTLDASAAPQVDRSMLRGVPLMQENYVDQNYGSRNRVENVNIDHPDARIQYGLQEEQHRDEFDRRVQEQFKRDFVENARRDGVDVTLDADGNVIRVTPLDPSQGAARAPGGGFTSGAVR